MTSAQVTSHCSSVRTQGTVYGANQNLAGACAYGTNFANTYQYPWSQYNATTPTTYIAIDQPLFMGSATCGTCLWMRGTGAALRSDGQCLHSAAHVDGTGTAVAALIDILQCTGTHEASATHHESSFMLELRCLVRHVCDEPHFHLRMQGHRRGRPRRFRRELLYTRSYAPCISDAHHCRLRRQGHRRGGQGDPADVAVRRRGQRVPRVPAAQSGPGAQLRHRRWHLADRLVSGTLYN